MQIPNSSTPKDIIRTLYDCIRQNRSKGFADLDRSNGRNGPDGFVADAGHLHRKAGREMRFLLFALALSGTGSAWASPAADAVLSANRTAIGPVPATGTVLVEFDYAGQGMTGSAQSTFDLRTGAFVDLQSAGPTRSGNGFDGRTPWMRDLSGAVTLQQGGDRIPLAVNEAYRNANLWWRADHGGASIDYLGVETIDGRSMERLAVTPRKGRRFEAWFDSETHLLRRIEEPQMFLMIRTDFDAYRPEAGLLFAHRLTIDDGTGESNRQVLTLSSLKINGARPPKFYAAPQEPLTGAAIEGGDTLSLPFRLLNNHVYIDVNVNGKGPFTFLVDSGGHTILSPVLASELGLNSEGAAPATGAGESVSTNGYTRVSDIALGKLHLRDQTALTLNIYDPGIEGFRVDGMLGFELFRRFAVRIDYGTQVITFIKPEVFNGKGEGRAVPFVFYSHLPQVRGRLGDLPARFDIDTGSRAEVDVPTPFVAANNLRTRYAHGTEAITGWGVGGPAKSYVVRVPALSLGTVVAKNIVAGLSGAKGGSFSDPNTEGNIGGGLLKRFVVTFDYAHQMLYFKPIRPVPADIATFDRSGMWINARDSGFEVTMVAPNSPASEAGLKVGDIITEFSGRKAAPSDLSRVRRDLRTLAPNTTVHVEVSRDGVPSRFDLILRDRI